MNGIRDEVALDSTHFSFWESVTHISLEVHSHCYKQLILHRSALFEKLAVSQLLFITVFVKALCLGQGCPGHRLEFLCNILLKRLDAGVSFSSRFYYKRLSILHP